MNGNRVSFSWLRGINHGWAIEMFNGYEDSYLNGRSPSFKKRHCFNVDERKAMKRLPKIIVSNRLRAKDIPVVRDQIASDQGFICPICSTDLIDKTRCLDHDHATGAIRGVLCLNCNQIEGKIKNLARRGKRDLNPREFLESIIWYWDKHSNNPDPRLHPTHLTEEEKRLRRNAKARARRKKQKE